ncbi:hypothetical protein K503DRAFT_416092 [Rhizopogon vinicolor AM-OR11-026]|uniref:Uncharacterized protein n=1 Tax=Rhizopogon vinicolor AM-OR11-026 TaxID=1314800 RepID=A0A1B7NB98_9AGAM|nr:hypothetical protein K503DRAFT_416092 [Rhizopogon vinicolor AM-OR11-026]
MSQHDNIIDPVTLLNNWCMLFVFQIRHLPNYKLYFPAMRHPYLAVGALLCISANPEILLTPLRLTGRITEDICLLPSQVIIWPFKVFGRFILGFRKHGLERSSSLINYINLFIANQICQSFMELQSNGATNQREKSELAAFVSVWSGVRAVRVLGRTWGWASLLGGNGALVCWMEGKSTSLCQSEMLSMYRMYMYELLSA